MAELIEYTANDEMPNCGQCDHICDNFNCEKFCGPEHGWWGYRRTERVDLEKIIHHVLHASKETVKEG